MTKNNLCNGPPQGRTTNSLGWRRWRLIRKSAAVPSLILGALILEACMAADGTDTGSGLVWQTELPARTPSWEEYRDAHTVPQSDGTNLYVIAEDLSTSQESELKEYYEHLFPSDAKKSVGVLDGGLFVKWPKHTISYCVGSDANWGTPIDANRRAYIRALMVESSRIWPRRANIRWVEDNTLGSNCELSEPSAGHVDFAVVAGPAVDGDGNPLYGGNAFFPNTAVANRLFRANLGIFGLPYYASFVSTGVVPTGTKDSDVPFFVHELGHTCGLDHEHVHSGGWNPNPPISGPDMSRCSDHAPVDADLTAQTDYCSVMTTYGCNMNASWQEANCPGHFASVISVLDGDGLARLYGIAAWWAAL